MPQGDDNDALRPSANYWQIISQNNIANQRGILAQTITSSLKGQISSQAEAQCLQKPYLRFAQAHPLSRARPLLQLPRGGRHQVEVQRGGPVKLPNWRIILLEQLFAGGEGAAGDPQQAQEAEVQEGERALAGGAKGSMEQADHQAAGPDGRTDQHRDQLPL